MPLKKFYAPTLPGALRAVKEAFGDRAVILSTRELKPGEWRPFSAAVSGFAVVASDDPLLATQMLEHLLAQGVERGFVESLISGIAKEALEEPDWLEDATCRGLSQYIPVIPSLERARDLETAIALVGPSGAGKSTCAAKIAALLRLKFEVPVQIGALCLPGEQVSESLRLAGALSGVPVEPIPAFNNIAEFCLKYAGRRKVVLDLSLADNWLGRLSGRTASVLASGNIETHLVLSSGSKTEDLLAATANLSQASRCGGLILTKFDETRTFGSAFDTVRKSAIPAAFFSTGRRIPEDLAAANAEVLARRLTENWRRGANGEIEAPRATIRRVDYAA